MRAPLFVLCFSLLVAAEPPPLRHPEFLTEYAQTRGYVLGRPTRPRLSASGKILFLRSGPRERTQSLYQWEAGQARPLLTPQQLLGGQDEQLSPEEKARRERTRQLGSGITDFFPAPHAEVLLIPLSGRLYTFELDSRKVRALPVAGPVLDPKWSPDGSKIAYLRKHDLYCYDLKRGRELPITQGGTALVRHGEAEFVAQEEMHRLSGYCWGPDSSQVAFQETDHRGVEVWHISDPLHPEAPPVAQYYPRPGKKNVASRLGVVKLGQKPRYYALPDEYLGGLRWDSRGGLTVQLQDRLQRRLRLLRLTASGGWQPLVEQRLQRPGWLPLRQDVPHWLDSRRFLWVGGQGDRGGLAVVEAGRSEMRFLDPKQDYDLLDIVRYDPERKAALCRIDRTPGKPGLAWIGLEKGREELPLEGIAELVAGPAGWLAQQQTLEHYPRLLWLPQGQPERLQVVESVGIEPSLQPHIQMETVEAGGQSYRTAWLRPSDWQPGRKYPVILDVYGGPTKVQVGHSRRNWLMDQWLAEQGFVVVAADNRGTPGRGRAWELAIYQRFHDLPLEDQVAALRGLAARHPEFDLERVGIWGWSFGGYLAARAVLTHPDVFRAAVAGAPVTDWLDYDTHYTERYLGLPQSGSAYRQADLLTLAPQLRRPLLLVHGSADDNVYYRHSLKLSEALFRAGRPYELLTLPGITHSFRADVGVTERLWARTVEFFRSHLR